MTNILPLLFILPSLALAKPSAKDVDGVLAGYRAAKAIQAKVNKTVEQETLQSIMKSNGDFFFSKGKMRLDIKEPERTTLVYDGKIIWLEQRLDDEHIQVTKMKAVEMRRSNSLLAALFDKKDILKTFDLKSAKSAGAKTLYKFEAKDKKNSDVKLLDIAIKDKDISSISYKDQLDNRVTLEFSDLVKGAVAKDKFSYKPPKNAEVTNLK